MPSREITSAGRPVLFDNTTRRDTDDATVPVITVNYNAVRFVKMWLPLKALAYFVEDFAFFFLSLGGFR